MPQYRVKYTRENGPDAAGNKRKPTVLEKIITTSRPEKVPARAAAAFKGQALGSYVLTWEELADASPEGEGELNPAPAVDGLSGFEDPDTGFRDADEEPAPSEKKAKGSKAPS